jgi:hypothetical protein
MSYKSNKPHCPFYGISIASCNTVYITQLSLLNSDNNSDYILTYAY